jgi:uncharacterized protein YqeY
MISLSQIESDLKAALKAKDSLTANTLRGLKARIQNEQTANGRPERSEGSPAGTGKKDLAEAELLALVRSEVKRRKDAQEAYINGGRQDLADKEAAEAKILEVFLPAQMPQEQLSATIDKTISAMSATAADFGKVMGKLKAELGDAADGATLAKLLKEKLK